MNGNTEWAQDVCRENQHSFLKNWHPVREPLSFAAKRKNKNQKTKTTKSRQTNTSHCPTKTISKTDTHTLKKMTRIKQITSRNYLYFLHRH